MAKALGGSLCFGVFRSITRGFMRLRLWVQLGANRGAAQKPPSGGGDAARRESCSTLLQTRDRVPPEWRISWPLNDLSWS